MTLLVDPPAWPAHGRLWSHLASDVSFGELHAFAALLKVPRRAFDGDHYDVPAERYDEIVAAGASAVACRELLARVRSAGLRRPKRRGERIVAEHHEDGDRIDVVLSTLTPPMGTVVAKVVVMTWDRWLWLPEGRLPQVGVAARDVGVRGGELRSDRGVPLGYLRRVPGGSSVAGRWQITRVWHHRLIGDRPPTGLVAGTALAGTAIADHWWPLLVAATERASV